MFLINFMKNKIYETDNIISNLSMITPNDITKHYNNESILIK